MTYIALVAADRVIVTACFFLLNLFAGGRVGSVPPTGFRLVMVEVALRKAVRLEEMEGIVAYGKTLLLVKVEEEEEEEEEEDEEEVVALSLLNICAENDRP